MLYQSDVTQRTHMEAALAKLTEIQLGMLCQVKTKCVGSTQGRCRWMCQGWNT